jgi:hypothetical protein
MVTVIDRRHSRRSYVNFQLLTDLSRIQRYTVISTSMKSRMLLAVTNNRHEFALLIELFLMANSVSVFQSMIRF